MNPHHPHTNVAGFTPASCEVSSKDIARKFKEFQERRRAEGRSTDVRRMTAAQRAERRKMMK